MLAREGVDNGLLGSADGEVFFPHDLVREAVYADIPLDDRRALHRACARYVVGAGGSALVAATHFRASAVQDDEEAVLALEQAARECMASMPDQAAELAQHAFALTSDTHPSWLLAGERTVETLVNVQREGEALAVADRLLAVAVEPEAIARIELQACRALWCAGDCAQMEGRAAGALVRDGVSAVLRAQLAAAQALAASRTRSAARAEAMARDALAEGRRLNGPLHPATRRRRVDRGRPQRGPTPTRPRPFHAPAPAVGFGVPGRGDPDASAPRPLRRRRGHAGQDPRGPRRRRPLALDALRADVAGPQPRPLRCRRGGCAHAVEARGRDWELRVSAQRAHGARRRVDLPGRSCEGRGAVHAPPRTIATPRTDAVSLGCA